MAWTYPNPLVLSLELEGGSTDQDSKVEPCQPGPSWLSGSSHMDLCAGLQPKIR